MKYEAYASGEYNDNSAPFGGIIAHPNAKQVFGDDWESARNDCKYFASLTLPLLKFSVVARSLIPEAVKAVKAGAFTGLESAAWIYAHVFDELFLKDSE